MKTLRIQGAIVWVWGVLKWTFSTTTVTHILKVGKKATLGDVMSITRKSSAKVLHTYVGPIINRMHFKGKQVKRCRFYIPA